nr:MAG TPA: Protein of unknown function (DUF3289) [Caudoviricetes sp.]
MRPSGFAPFLLGTRTFLVPVQKFRYQVARLPLFPIPFVLQRYEKYTYQPNIINSFPDTYDDF